VWHVQSGLLFGLPIVLDTNSEDIQPGDKVLMTYQGTAIAAVTIDSKWTPNKPLECLKCYGTSSLEHPAVQMVAMERGKYYMGECPRLGRGQSRSRQLQRRTA
jgi:sulfate adenylyltransferase